MKTSFDTVMTLNKSFSLSQLNEKLEETGSNTAAQIALNTRREEELAKLKMELDE